MASGFPEFEHTHPILTPQKVATAAEGYDAFGRVLGSLAEKAGDKAEKIAADKSNSMYLSSVANVDQLKLSTQENILKDPSNAMEYTKRMRDNIDQVAQAAYVNDEDRKKIRSYAKKSYGGVELEAVRAEVKQTQIGTAFEFYKNWDFQLDALRQSANNPEKYEQLKDSMVKHLESLALTGAITPYQAGSHIKEMSAVTGLAMREHRLYGSPDEHTAENYHTAMQNPYSQNRTGNVNYPADENTRWLVDHHATDMTFQGALSGLYEHRKPDPEVFSKLKPHQQDELMLTYEGISQADGLIDSNAPYTEIEKRVNDLQGKTDYSSVAQKKALNQYLIDVKNGNSQKLMARTTIGGQIVKDYTDKISYYSNQLKNTDPQNTKEIGNLKMAINNAKNDFVNQSIAYGEAHHWPVMQPIPQEDLMAVQNGFNLGTKEGEAFANANRALDTIKGYSPQNQLYVAKGMKNPKQRAVMQTISLSGKNGTDQEKLDFMLANQNRTYKEVDQTTEKNVHNSDLNNQINTQITPAINIINAQNDSADAIALNGGLVLAGINYAKFLAEKNGQFTLKSAMFGSSDHVGDVVNLINRSYQPLSGANYIINKNQNDIDSQSMDYVAQYAINKGNEYRRSQTDEATFQQLNSQAPLSVTITPTNNLVAKDINGNIVYKAPFSSSIIDIAKRSVDKQSEQAKKDQFKPIMKRGGYR